MTDIDATEIPIDLKELNRLSKKEEVRYFIQNTIENSEGDLDHLFEKYIDEDDFRTSFASGSLDASDIEITHENGKLLGYVNITFQLEYYAGCEDVNTTFDKEHFIEFEITNKDLILMYELPIPWSNEAY